MKTALRLLGFGLILGGLICMPLPVANPEATTSIFPWLAMNGELMRVGVGAMVIGALILALSFAIRGAD